MISLPKVIAVAGSIGGCLSVGIRVSSYSWDADLPEGLAMAIFLEDALAWFGQGVVVGVFYLAIPIAWIIDRHRPSRSL